MPSQVQDPNLASAAGIERVSLELQRQDELLKTGALQTAIFNSANFSSIATDAKGVIQIFNVGAERMLGYSAVDVLNRITPADISDPEELVTRARTLSAEFDTLITPGFEALVFKASRGIEDIYELTYIRKDGSRFPAVVSVTALHDGEGAIIGYLLIGTDNTERKKIEAERRQLFSNQEQLNKRLLEAYATLQASEDKLLITLNSIGDAVLTTDAEARIVLLNPVAELLTGWSRAEAAGRPVDEVFKIVNKETRMRAPVPILETLAKGTIQGLANHTVLVAVDGSECDIADSCAPIRNPDGRVTGAVLVFRDVTQEYAAQAALRDSNALVQTVLNTVEDGIVTLHALTGVVENVNPAAERMFGYSAAELAGKKFGQLIPELDRKQGFDTTSIAYYSASEETRASGRGREVCGVRKDGAKFPIEIAVSEMRLGGQRFFTGVLRDITARKHAEAELIKAGALQNAIFNSANFSSIATDANGVIQIFNVGAERMLGYAAADVVNIITPSEISDPQEIISRALALSEELATTIKPGFEALVFKASRGIEDIYELTYIRRDGSRLPAIVSVTALRDAQNAIIGYLLIGTDNTARKQVEAERRQVEFKLQTAMAGAEKANLAKSEFLSSMSHELRTPLSAILGFAQLMDSGLPVPSAMQKRSIGQILKAGWYLLDLINEILDLALVESGKLSLSLEPISLGEVLHECQTMIEPQAQKKGIVVTFPHFHAPCFVKADRTRVKQILINLLSNALKYNRMGGTVTVSCSLRDGHIRISIGDTGAGLTPVQVSQLFQPFNRLGQELLTEEGTGIGLVMTKRLVELMGGTIGVESVHGQGSVFWIEMELTEAPRLGAANDEQAALPEEKNNAVRTLLYVEDNPANLMLVEDLISRRPDLRLVSAREGIEGISLARTVVPDMILMDINLPGISGIKVMELLAQDKLTSHIPVVALSANAMPRDIEKGLLAGFFRYLTKPIKVAEFMETLNVTLEFAEQRVRQKID